MSQIHDSTNPNQFIKIIATSNLTTFPSQHTSNNTFTTILTESSLLETEDSIPTTPSTNIVEFYDQMFPTFDMYQSFVDQWLLIWKNNLEF